MKLIYRILIHLSLALPIILAAWGILFYMAIIDEVNDEVDDSLEDYSEVLITRALAGEQLPSQSDGSNNSYYLITVTADYAEKQKRIRYSDEMVHIEAKGETEPARVLRTIFKDKDRQYYELTVSTPTIEKQDLQEAILNWMLLLYFSLLLLILLVNTWVYYRSMRPLYVLLKWMDQYTIGKSQSPPDLQTNITEFRKLNEAAIQTHRRNQAIYEQQKQFIGNASHELQTPLAICQNRLEMMAESESLTEDQLTEIAKIQQTLTYIIRLNKSLLFLSKIENGQFQESQEICLNDLISSQLEDYQEIYDYKNIQVEVHQSATLTVNMNETLATQTCSKMLLSTINHKEKSTSKFSPITLPFAIPVTRKHWMPPVYSIVSIKANIPVKAPAAWACLLPNRSANYISFTSDIIIQESIVSRSIFSISRNKIHFFPDFKIFSVLGSTFEL